MSKSIFGLAWLYLALLPGIAVSTPAILSFSPAAAQPGAIVTIEGLDFAPNPDSNIVYFGAVRGVVTSASPTNLTARVPAGATYAPLTLIVDGLTACSPQRFLPTFDSDGSPVSTATFAPGQNFNTANGPYQTLIADLDGDGKPDLIVANVYAHVVSIYQNIGSAGTLNSNSFAPRIDLPLALGTTTDNPLGIEVADVDGDGQLDILVCDRANNQLLVCRNVATPGSLTTNSFSPPVPFATGNDPRRVHVADLDGDGKPDLIVANYGSSTISILQNVGSPGALDTNSFAPAFELPTTNSVYGFAVADLDGDGRPDLVGATPGAASVAVFLNLSVPGTLDLDSFAAETNFPSPNNCESVIAADLDGDGRPDLIVGSIQGNAMAVLRNLSAPGAPAFADHVDFNAPGWVHNVAVGDLNGDGKPDLAIDGELPSFMGVYQNGSAPGSFSNASLSNRVDFSTGWNVWGISVGDLDGDGRPDIVFGNSYDSTITLYRNTTPFAGALDHFEWNPIPSQQFTNAPFPVTLVARTRSNGVATNFSGPMLLTGANGLPVPATSGSFVQGIWSGTVAVSQLATNLVLRADDGLGHFGLANPINVMAPPALAVTSSGNLLLVYWPSAPSGFVLEMSPSLSPAQWVRVPGPPIQIGTEYLGVLQAPGANQFYRLRYSGP